MRSVRRYSASRSQSILARLRNATRHVGVELLENRRLMSTVVVNTAVDQADAPGSSTVSLRDAITFASNSLTATNITFDPTVFATPQTITLQGNSALVLTSGQDVTITGPAVGVTVDAGGNSNVLRDLASAGNVNISNMTLTNGTGYYGGGLDHEGADTLTITNVTVSNNSAKYDGGGIYNTGMMVIDHSTITGNTNLNNTGYDGAGGGVLNLNGTMTVTDSTISGNSSVVAGAIGGAGIAGINGSLTIVGCTISGNTNYSDASGTPANAPGGGILSTGTLTVTNTTVTGNTGNSGGGIFAYGTTSIFDSTITGNTGTMGGGIYARAAVTIGNTVVAGNTYMSGGSGPDVASQTSTSVLSQGFNFIGESDGSTGWIGSDLLGSIATPLNPQLGTLGNNGGPTKTQLPQPGSPLIDAGSNSLIPTGVTTDQRGFARINNTTVDIGSVETQAVISVTAPSAQTAVINTSKSFMLGSFTEIGAVGPYSVDVNWGDGSTDTTFSAASPGAIAAQMHTFAALGVKTVTVTVTDSSGTVTGNASFNVAVAAGTLTVTPAANQTAFVGVSKTFSLGSFVETSATGPYAVVVNWGDGSTNTTFSLNAAGTITAEPHTFTAPGADTVQVTVTDSTGTVTGTGTFTVTVSLGTIAVTAPAAQTAALNVSKSFALGSFTATNAAGPFTVDVGWGDGTTDTTFTVNSSGTITPQTHTFTAVGTLPVTVTVSDSTGLVSNFATFNVVVSGPTITLTAPAAQTALIGSSKSFALGSFTETNAVSPYTVVVDWGDGSTPTTFTTNSAGTIPAKSHTYVSAGSDTVTVTVTDSSGGATASTTFAVTVNTGTTPSTTSLTASAVSVLSSQSVTLTATVTPSNATGTVTFEENGTAIGTANISGGVATLVTTTLPAGTDGITATYSGDATFAASTSTIVTVVVAPPPNATSLSLGSSSSALSTNQSVTLTATLTPFTAGSNVATGTVTFFEAGTALGTAPLQSNGTATFTTTTGLPVGTDPLTATYSGDTAFATSTATAIDVTVIAAGSSTKLTLSNQSKTVAQVVSFSASVGPDAVSPTTLAGIFPSGTVTFVEDGNVLGTVPLGTDGTATLTESTTLPTGVDLITATFTGSNALFANSTSSTLDLSVTQHALVPVVTKAVVPATPPVGGTAVRGSYVTAKLTNDLTDIETGTEKGIFGVRLFASTDTTLDPSVDPIVATYQKNAKIAEGKSVTVKVPINSLPATLPTGTYHLLMETTDSRGNTEIIDTGSSVSVVAPVITLSGSFAGVPANVVKNGATISLSTTGNTNDLSSFTAVVGFSTDAAGQNLVATGVGVVKPVKTLIRLGKTTKLKVTGWQSLFAGLPGGAFYLTVTLTDATGHSVLIVSPTTV